MFSWLFGGTKAASKVLDAGISAGDALVFTAEEKAEYQKEIAKMHLKMIELTANESTAQSITRRMICVPVVYIWLGMIVLSVVIEALGGKVDVVGKAIEAMSLPALASIGFYVGRHMLANSK